MDVSRCSDEIAEVCVKGSNGYKCVVNLQQRTCSCRKFQVSGIPCLHAIAFITSVREPLEKYVDPYYSVEKFRAAYENLIPAMTDKSQWQQSNPGFFMHPPLLKSIAGRRKKERFKGCAESNGSTTRKKGQHRCHICQGYGHHWQTCKNGDPDDIAAMLAERGPPKKKKKINDSSQGCSNNLSSGKSVKSACDSSQPEPPCIEYPSSKTTQPLASSKPTKNRKAEGKAKEGKAKARKTKAVKANKKQDLVPPHSPAMCTRSKSPNSPAMGTRSKRKILD